MSKLIRLQPLNDEWYLPHAVFLRRLRAKLARLIPYREMIVQHHDYHIRIVSKPGDGDHFRTLGPYYFKHFVALADMLNMWDVQERALPNKTVVSRKGTTVPQVPLPPELQFEVVSDVLAGAVTQLRAQGWKVIPPEPDTAAVTPRDFVTVKPDFSSYESGYEPPDDRARR